MAKGILLNSYLCRTVQFMQLHISIVLLFLISPALNFAQSSCTTLGQNPSTAFPVCGSNVFTQAVVPICGNTTIPAGCPNIVITDKNPFWYKFKCYSSGTLGFLITPFNLGDDYDWQLWDVTNRDPNDVYTDPSLKVAYNWSGEVGLTGASSAGPRLFVCAGPGQPLFSSMPSLIIGHDYLLLISHFSDSQSGYNLSFGGGTALITDTLPPAMVSALAGCDAMHVLVKLNKKMKCSSLDPGGSDFSITPAGAPIVSAIGNSCGSGFDFDSILITFASLLPFNNYTLTINNGSDGNTISDVCDNTIPAGQTLPFAVVPFQPTPLDSISPVGCAPTLLHLVFSRPILCNTIAADGSDFVVNGPSTVVVQSANGQCNGNGLTGGIDVHLSGPIYKGGIYQLILINGSDGNTIINECGLPTPVGSFINFTIRDTVTAAFTYQQKNGCHVDTVQFIGNATNGINTWKWYRDNILFSSIQDPLTAFPASGQHNIRLEVSNGGCTDSTSQVLIFDNEVRANFEVTDIVCPVDSAHFKNTTTGLVSNWYWEFGDGGISTLKDPVSYKYPVVRKETFFTIRLTASNNFCSDMITKKIRVLANCFIAVPGAFTPNGDGLNDYLYPLNAFKADNLDFKVYNRWGKLVFQTTDWTKKWDGRIGQEPQDTGMYVWILAYIDRDTKIQHRSKGTTLLIR